jgi:hypothetical protein
MSKAKKDKKDNTYKVVIFHGDKQMVGHLGLCFEDVDLIEKFIQRKIQGRHQRTTEETEGQRILLNAQEEANAAGQWTDKLKEKAVIGEAMVTNAECGVTDFLQIALNKDKYARDEYAELVSEQFERVFTKGYKKINPKKK